MRRGMLLLAALLLACVLMAGAVSATGTTGTAGSYDELVANLSNDQYNTIELRKSFSTSMPIFVNRSVVIDGQGFTISADNSSGKFKWVSGHASGETNCYHLLEIVGLDSNGQVTLKDIRFENGDISNSHNGGAYGLNFWNATADHGQTITLNNVTINASQGSGLTMKGVNVSATNLTITNSGWGQSIDIQRTTNVVSNLTIDTLEKLGDPTQISDEGKTESDQVFVGSNGAMKPTHSWFVTPKSGSGYTHDRNVWATDSNYATKAGFGIFNASVQNVSGPVALHMDLKKALENYAADGATVTLLQEISSLSEPIVISKNITFDGADKKITSANAEKAPMLITATSEVTLKNVNLTANNLKNYTLIQAVTVSGTTINAPTKLTVENCGLSATFDTSAASSGDGDNLAAGNYQFFGILTRPSSDLIVKDSTITLTGKNTLDHIYPIKFKAQNDTNLNVSITGNTFSVTNTSLSSSAVYAVTGVTPDSAGKLAMTISENTVTATTNGNTAKLLYYTPVVNNSNFVITKNALTLSGKENYVMDVMLATTASGNHAVNFEMAENIVTIDSSAPAEKTFYAVKFAQRAWTDGKDRTAYLKGKIASSNTFMGKSDYLFIKQDNLQSDKTLINVDTTGLTIEGQTISLAIVAPYGTGIDLNNATQKNGTAKKFTVTPAGTAVSWTSSNPGVLTIQADGNYTALATGTTTITATGANNAKAEMLITVYANTETNLPITDVTTETNEGGETTKNTISNSSDVEITDNIVTITDESSGVKMTIVSSDTPVVGSGSVTVNVSTETNNVSLNIPENVTVLSPEVATIASEPVNVEVNVSLKNVTFHIPTFERDYKEDVKTGIGQHHDLSKYTIISMLSATGDNVSRINQNITAQGGTVEVTFNISLADLHALLGTTSPSAYGKLKVFHYKAADGTADIKTGNGRVDGNRYYYTVTGNGFSSYVLGAYTDVAPTPGGGGSSGDGNMNGAYRVLFETNGGSFIRPATDLSAGDKITAPANPVKDGYTFAGWYKDAACTQGWSFSDAIDGDMTLYAKWTGGSAAQQTTTETAAPTAQPTTKQTTAPVQTQSQGTSATTAAPVATTAAGGQPTLTQAPAPVLGALLGLLAAGVLLRRRE